MPTPAVVLVEAPRTPTAEREELSEAADEVQFDLASYQHDFDRDAEARATLKQVRKPDPDSVFIAILQTQLGNTAFGQQSREKQEANNPQGTLMKFFYLPILRSELQMIRGKPLDAIAALEPVECPALLVPVRLRETAPGTPSRPHAFVP